MTQQANSAQKQLDSEQIQVTISTVLESTQMTLTVLIEEFLVNVYKSRTPCKTMDELKYHLFHQSKKKYSGSTPNSRAIQGHVLKAFYGTYLQLHCLTKMQLDPQNFGYSVADGILQPDRRQIILPENFPMPCKCTSCATKQCPCSHLVLRWCQYCN